MHPAFIAGQQAPLIHRLGARNDGDGAPRMILPGIIDLAPFHDDADVNGFLLFHEVIIA